MDDRNIYFRSGYKHQLSQDYTIKTNLKPKRLIDTKFINLDLTGQLTVKEGYAWDGASGPVIDTSANLRASLVHDALYQLMRQNHLKPRSDYKDKADRLFKDLCKEDGVPSALAQFYYEGLKRFGKPSTDPKNIKDINKAP